MRAFIDTQLERLRELGYDVESCLVDSGQTAEERLLESLRKRQFDCVMIGAGLRAPQHLRLFEALLNQVHRQLPQAAICFNTTAADTVETLQRCAKPR